MLDAVASPPGHASTKALTHCRRRDIFPTILATLYQYPRMRTIAHRRQQNDGVQADRFVPQSDDAQPQRATRRAAEPAVARSIFDSVVMVLGPAAPG